MVKRSELLRVIEAVSAGGSQLMSPLSDLVGHLQSGSLQEALR
jgi:hypothetical protein